MITKQAYEEFYRYHEFLRPDGRGWLDTAETIVSATVTAVDQADSTDCSATMVANVAAYGTPQTQVKYQLKAGTSGHTYTINIKAVTSAGQKFEDDVELEVMG